MSKQDLLELSGIVEEVLPSNFFRVKVEISATPLLCYLGGKLKQHKIKITAGDKVKIELSPYDLTRGRVIYRL